MMQGAGCTVAMYLLPTIYRCTQINACIVAESQCSAAGRPDLQLPILSESPEQLNKLNV